MQTHLSLLSCLSLFITQMTHSVGYHGILANTDEGLPVQEAHLDLTSLIMLKKISLYCATLIEVINQKINV